MSSTPWPHQFTKNGKEVQVGEEPLFGYDEDGKKRGIGVRKITAQPMICVHCKKTFIQGKDSYPVGPCPARNDKREAKRLGVDIKAVRGER